MHLVVRLKASKFVVSKKHTDKFIFIHLNCVLLLTASVTPFRLIYPDGTESAVTAVSTSNVIGASVDTANTGFCLDFVEKVL